jgi:hypothetical protein
VYGIGASGAVPLQTFEEYQGSSVWVNDVWVTPGAHIAVSRGGDGTLRIWDLPTETCLHTLWEQSFVALAAHGTLLLSRKEEELHLWDLASGQCLRTISCGAHLALLPDEGLILSTKDQQPAALWDLATGTRVGELGTMNGSFMIGPDGQMALAAKEGAIGVWNLATGERVRTLAESGVDLSRHFLTPNGRRLILRRDGTLGVWDLVSGQLVQTFPAPQYGRELEIPWVADGQIVVAVGPGGFLRAWDLRSGQCLGLHHVGDPVRSLSPLRPDGRFACGTENGSLHFLALRGKKWAVPVLTAARRLRLDRQILRKPGTADRTVPLYAEGERLPVLDDGQPGADCPWCGRRLTVPASFLDLLTGIHRAAGLRPGQSPCLALPQEAWNEPRLRGACPQCHGRLRFNPFVADTARSGTGRKRSKA